MAHVTRLQALLKAILEHPELEFLEGGPGSEVVVPFRMQADAMRPRPLNRHIAMLARKRRVARYHLLPEILGLVLQPLEFFNFTFALPKTLVIHKLYCAADPVLSTGQTGSHPLDSGAACVRCSIDNARLLARKVILNRWVVPAQAQAAT